MPTDDFELSMEEQRILHDLTDEAVAPIEGTTIRENPFGEVQEPQVSVPDSPWQQVSSPYIPTDSAMDDPALYSDVDPVISNIEEADAEDTEEAEGGEINRPHQEDGIAGGVQEETGEQEEDEEAPEEVIEGIIPANAEVFDETTTARFSSAIWFERLKDKVIILAGVGGIGSWTALLLGKLQPRGIYMYDDDTVESVNMAGQLYSIDDVGKTKVDAIANTMMKYAPYTGAFAVNMSYTQEREPGDIMICGFDNMDARKTFFRSWKRLVLYKPEEERSNCLFIDGRLAAEELQVFCITGDNDYQMDKYEADYLFSDYEAEATVCSYKQTAFAASMISGIIVNLLVNFVANECNPPIPRSLPFKTLYNAEMMMFSVEEE